jgi:sialate O-acetylesterase
MVLLGSVAGEVWLCSGQSDMEMGVRMCADGEEEEANARYPCNRLLMEPNRWSPEPQTDKEASWKVCSSPERSAGPERAGIPRVPTGVRP